MRKTRTITPWQVLLRPVLLALALLCLAPTARTEVLFDEEHFPDSEFRSYLRNRFKFTEGEIISDAQLAGVTWISVGYYQKLENLIGIEHFTNLTSLTLGASYSPTNITALDLSHNTALTTLKIYGALDFNDVHAPTSLTTLTLSGGAYTTLSLDPSYTALKELTISSCALLEEIDLSGLKNLPSLCIANNAKLASLDLGGMDALRSLAITNNNLLEEVGLRNMKSLKSLSVGSNAKLTSLDLSGCTALTSLDCYTGNSALESLNLSGCTALTVAFCSGNKLNSIDLSGCTALYSLDCRDNQLASLDLSDCPALASLDCRDNKFTSLDLSGCTRLATLECAGNDLESLNLNGCSALTSLELYGFSSLTSLELSGCTALASLSLSSLSSLTSLDLSGCTALASLSLSYLSSLTSLASVDLSGCTALASLELHSLAFSSLDLSACPTLNSLYLSSLSSLTSLDLSVCPALASLECWYLSQLASLDLSECSALTSLYLRGLSFTSLDLSGSPALTSVELFQFNNLASLELSGFSELTSLHLEYLPSLTSLDLSGCTALTSLTSTKLSSLTSLNLSGCSSMTTLNCGSHAKLASLVLPEDAQFSGIGCYSCALTALDLSPIRSVESLSCGNNSSLSSLDCSGKGLRTLSVNNCTSLTTLDCSDNALSALNVSGCTKLKKVTAYGNPMRSSSGFGLTLPTASGGTLYASKDGSFGLTTAELSALKTSGWTAYYYDDTQEWLPYEADTSTAQNIPIDEDHFPDENFRGWLLAQSYGKDGVLTPSEILKITSFSPGYYYGVYQGNKIESLKGIEYLTSLASLSIGGTQVTSLDLSANTALVSLNCSGTKLEELDLSANTFLTTLYCSNTQLKELDLSANTALKTLDCSGCQLEALDLKANTALTTLVCGGNRLTEIDLSGFPALNFVNMDNSPLLASVNLSNTPLRGLKLAHNNLTQLNITNCSRLQLLNVRDNHLTELDFTGCGCLGAIDISDNNLSGNLKVDLCPVKLYGDYYSDDNEYWTRGEYDEFFDDLHESLPEHEYLDNAWNGAGFIENDWIHGSLIACSGNSLTGLDLSGSENLVYVNCDDNEIEQLLLPPCSTTTMTGDITYASDVQYRYSIYAYGGYHCSYPFLVGLQNVDYVAGRSTQYLSCNNNKLVSIELTGEKWLGLYANQYREVGANSSTEGDYIDVPITYGFDAEAYSVVNNGKHLSQVEKAYVGEGKHIYYLRLTEPLQSEQHIDSRLSCGFDLSRVLSWNSGAEVVHGTRGLQAALGRRGINTAKIQLDKVYGDILLLDEDAQRVTYTYATGADHGAYYATEDDIFEEAEVYASGWGLDYPHWSTMPLSPAIEGDDPVARADFFFTWSPENQVVTGIDLVRDSGSPTQSVTYVNPAGQVSDRPWQGVNIVVTRYTDGTTQTTKLVK